MRRRVGLGAIQQQQDEAKRYEDKGAKMEENQFQQLTKNMAIFKEKLEEFAMNHKQDIKKNPQFRRQFQEMCAAIGVDPLASRKGFWSVLDLGDFYYELSVQVIEVCLAAHKSTGGLMELEELRNRLVAARGSNAAHQEITKEDILVAADKLKVLGNDFKVLKVGKGKYLIQSIPGELSLDESTLLNLASNTEDGCITEDLIKEKLQ